MKMLIRLVQKVSIRSTLRRWVYNLSGFNKYGLMRDDCIYIDQDVEEALSRLPQDKMVARNFRILRALELKLHKTVLPKEQWTKFEDDELYLTPLVKQVKKEKRAYKNKEKEINAAVRA